MRRLFAVFFAFLAFGAHANWESGDVYYDDGARLVVGVRGGMALPFANMKNDLTMSAYFCANGKPLGDPDCDTQTTEIELGALPVAKKYDDSSFAGGAAVGMVVPHNPNLRLELDWLHIAESRFDANPLFSGEVTLPAHGKVTYPVGAATSRVQTDVVSAFMYYDFFDGRQKPAGTVIPYVGVGIGYATSATILALADAYSDFGGDPMMDEFSESGTLIDYYSSRTESNNFALSLAFGAAYGIGDGMYIDVGARGSLIPRIRWALNNEADASAGTPKEYGVFSAENIAFVNVYAGLRFEF